MLLSHPLRSVFMSEILLVLVSFLQVKIGLDLTLCAIFTVDISFTVLSNCGIIRSFISSSL